MKQKLIKLLTKAVKVVMAVGIISLLTPETASATGSLNSLNITNNLQGNSSVVVITGYPTNSFNPTNGFPMGTGQPVYIGNFKAFGFDVQGFLVNTGAATTATFTLIGAQSGGSPQMTAGTNQLSANQTVLTKADWESVYSTTNLATMIGYPVVVPIPGFTTNWINWYTNFDIGWSRLAGANWVGCYSISNNLTTGCFLTNSAAYINTKIIPVGLIGN